MIRLTKNLKLFFKIYFSLRIANVIVTSSKMPFLWKDEPLDEPLQYENRKTDEGKLQ